MKLNRTILLVIISVLVLNLQSGCEETAKVPQPGRKVTAPSPEKATKAVEDKKPQIRKTQKAPNRIQAKDSQKQEGKEPVIKVTNPVHDFGKVAPSKKYNCQFEFKNVGNAQLKITKIQTTCGCTVAQLKKKAYAPGESGTIKVTFRTPSRQGSTSKHLYILSNDKKNPKFALTLKATVELKVVFKPKLLELSLKAENAGARPVTITSKDGQPFAIKSITSTSNVITASFDPAVKATEFVLEPKVDVQKLKKNLKGNIKIDTTHPDTSLINIPYSAPALFDISRPRIVIQNADPQNPVVKTIWITSNYGDEIEIESISSLNGHIEVLSRQAEESGVKLEVRVTPPAKTDKPKRYFMDELKIKIKGSADDLLVRCNGWYPRKPAKTK